MRPMPVTREHLDELIRAELSGLIDLRHDLHAHPQLCYEETYASERVQRELKALDLPHVAGLATTGVVAWLKREGHGDDAIGLRADMDALPVTEETDLPWASKHPGLMHACGHDGHTAMLVGAARVLSRLREELPRPVKFFFQPAEEGGAGADRLIKEGALDATIGGVRATAMFGLHGIPQLPLGVMATRVGPMLAATHTLQIIVAGQGGHAAMPHRTADPIVAASAVVTAIQTVTSRNVDPTEPLVVSITKMHGGEAFNVIPERVELGGTIRTLTEPTAALVTQRVTEIAEQVAAAHRCVATVTITPGYPVTSNHADAVAFANRHGAAELGADRVLEMPFPIMGGEDFAYYGVAVPSCFVFIGVCPPGVAEYPGLHTPRFDFTDDAIAVGVRLMCRWALESHELTPQR